MRCPNDPTANKEVAYLRPVGEPVRDAGMDGSSVSNRQPLLTEQLRQQRKRCWARQPAPRVSVKQHSHRGERNSNEEEDLWRLGVAAAMLFGIVAMFYLAVFTIITGSAPKYIEWLPLSAWPVALSGAGSARQPSAIRRKWSARCSCVDGSPHGKRRQNSSGISDIGSNVGFRNTSVT